MTQKNNLSNPQNHTALLQNIKQLIAEGKSRVVSQVNQTLVMTYWHIGQAINREVLQNSRAEYGNGFSAQNIFAGGVGYFR